MECTLEVMLRELEKMDDRLPLDLYSLPTAAEIRLYGLIHNHVNNYIQLFLTEDDSETQFSCKRPQEGQFGPPQDTASTSMEPQYTCKRPHKEEAGTSQGGKASASSSQGYTIKLPSVVCYNSVCKVFERTFSNYRDIKYLMGKCRLLLPYSQHISALNSSMDAISLADFGSKGYYIGSKEPLPGMNNSGPFTDKRWSGPELEPNTNAIVHPAAVAPAMASDCDMDVDLNEHTEELKEARRRLLHGILWQLVELGRLHSYAPPTETEVEYYRQIRKWTTSSLAQVKAKARKFVKGPTEAAKEKWLCAPLQCRLHTSSFYPKGHMMATVLDTLPGCLSLLEELLPRLASLCSHFYMDGWVKELSQDASREKCDHSSQVTKELEAQCYLTSEKEKGKLTVLFNAKSSVENGSTAIHEKKTREECLFAILRLLRRIITSFSSTVLNTQEVRLYVQVFEHVIASIWLFRNSRWDCLEQKAQGYYVKNIREGKNGLVEKFLIAPCTGSREPRSREEDLQEIVVLVEAIRSSFLDVLPTKKEEQLYHKIYDCVWRTLAHAVPRSFFKGNKKRKKSSCTPEDPSCTPEDGSKKRKESSCAPEDRTYIKNLVESIYSLELKWLQKLHEEYGKIIRMIIPSTSTELYWETNWRRDELHCKIMNEFDGQLSASRQHKLKILDGMLVMLEQAEIISGEAYSKIMDANNYLDTLVKEKRYMQVMEEVHSVFQVLQRSGSSFGCFQSF